MTTNDNYLNGVVAKSNSILQPLTALNLEERRLFTFCLQYYDSRPEAINPNMLVVPIEDLQKTFPPYASYKPNILLQKMRKAIFGIDAKGYQPDPKEDYIIRWFTSIDLRDRGKLKFGLTPESMPFFTNLRDNFIRYNVSDVRLIRKPTTWNLYEYIKEELGAFPKKTWKVDIDVLKERLGVLGKYQRSADFINKCIQTPINEINKLTDVKVNFKRQKKGMSVACFYFDAFIGKGTDIIEGETIESSIKDTLLNVGISAKKADVFIEEAKKNNTLIELDKKLVSIIKLSKQEKVKNSIGYITESIKKIIAGQKQLDFSSITAPQKEKPYKEPSIEKGNKKIEYNQYDVSFFYNICIGKVKGYELDEISKSIYFDGMSKDEFLGKYREVFLKNK